MSEWVAELAGNHSDLEYLGSEFSSDECSVRKERDRYDLRSTRFSPLTDASEVRDSASELLGIMNGLSPVLWPSFQAVKVAGIARVDEQGKRHYHVEGSVTLRCRVSASVTVVKSNGTVDSSQRPSEAQTLLQRAFKEPRVVGQALRIFGSLGTSDAEISRSLYRVYDIIKDNVGGENEIVRTGWATRSAIKLFTQTAQPDRHYEGGRYQCPPNPMDLRLARSLVRRILGDWLRSEPH